MTETAPQGVVPSTPDLFDSFRIATLAALLLGAVLALMASHSEDQIGHALYVKQDIWLLIAVYSIIAVTLLRRRYREFEFRFDKTRLILLVLLVIVFVFWGHSAILAGTQLSRDERLANFDAWIYARGMLAWPLPPEWQPDSEALNLLFMMRVEYPVSWVSAYLPMNAAIRALVGTVASSDLTGPLMTGLSLPLLWGCARKLWPEDREAAIVAVLLLASSGQFLFTGMTAFAMPAHLFFNLFWLWLFLKDRPGGDLLAIMIGFVATGLHQPLFHPLFVAPWLILLLYQRRIKRLAMFAVGYALVCGFWLWWPHHVLSLVVGPESLVRPGTVDYWSRLLATLRTNSNTFGLMGANLLRFFTWQHALLVPLIIFGWKSARSTATGLALFAGFILPIVVMALILPLQGFGFGYRYIHPVLGNAVLLAVIGWRRFGPLRDQMRAPFMLATALSVLVMLPMQAWMCNRVYSLIAEKELQIASSGADYVLLPPIQPTLVADFAFNNPDLSNRPLILLADPVRDMESLAVRLCRPGTRIALASDGMFIKMKRYFQTIDQDDRVWLSGTTRAFTAAGCSVGILR